MSTTSGPGNKGEKNKGKFKSIDINTLYKGKSVETQKSNVPRQYGLQSLGKVSSARRMPPPANLPSIKSENSGKDPSVNLVPSGGTGWVSKEEKKESSGGPPQQPSLLLQQATPTQPQQRQQQVTTKTNNSSGGQSSVAVRSWSSATGSVRQGGLVSHRSPLFQEEFPSLAQEEKHKEPAPPIKKEDTVKDIPYGPGPSLRPQNVASWREGGGRALPQPKPEEPTAVSPSSTQTEVQPNGPLTSGGSGAGVGVGADLPSQPLPPQRPSSSHGQPHGSLPLGPPMRMPPPQHRGMLPHYMFGRMPPGGYPMTFPGFPRNPFSHDRRFRGPNPPMPVERSRSDGEENQKRPAIVSEKALKDFDAVLKSDTLEGGWAEPQGDIDYSERLVFSDEEEDPGNREVRRRPTEAHQRDPDRDRDHKEEKDKEDEGGVMMHEGWPHGMPPPHYRGPMPPHPGMDAHGWPTHMRPFEFMGPRGVAPYPFRLPPPMHMRGYGPPAPTTAQPQQQPPASSPGAGPPRKMSEDDDELWRVKRRTNEGEINSAVERARMRREESEKKKETEQRAAADEKLRQLDERAKRKVDTKGSDTEGRDSRDTSESSDREMRESHHWNRPTNLTPPAQNDQADGKSYSRNVPPRFQKLQEPPMGQDQRQKQLPSPGGGTSPGQPTGPPIPRVFRSGQGPPPHFAGYDPRAWPGMPPHFHMDPRYGPRPPLDMQVYGPPTVMRRHDSHGSANDGQESESRHLEPYERLDPWSAWMERGYHPQAGHYEDMRRSSYYERAYQGFDIERRDFEHHDHGDGTQSDTNKAPKEVEQRPSLHQRDPFEDWNKVSDKEDRRSDRSSKDHTDWDLDRSFSKESNKEDSVDHYEKNDEEFNQKSSKDDFDQEETSYSRSYNRRDGRTGPTPKFRAYTSEEVRQREASQRAEAFSQNCPPPLLHDQSKQSVQAKASMTSLKRSASTMSNSSVVTSDKEKDRKNESPKESLIFERSLGSKKDGEKDNSKDEKSSQDKENKPPEQSRPNAWEIKEQDRQKVSKVKEEAEVVEIQKEEDERVRDLQERVDSPRGNLPPMKKKREDEQPRDRRDRENEQVRDRRDRDDEQGRDRRDRYSDDRREKDYERYSDRGDRSRGNPNRGGREFVRGRGAPRGSVRGGYNAGRGRDRDYFPSGYEKSSQAPHKSDRQPGKPFQKFDGDKNERDFDVKLPPRQKHGPSDDLSDVSADDSLGIFNDRDVSDRVLDKEISMAKEENHAVYTDNRQQEPRGRDQNKDFRSVQDHKNIWDQDLKMQEEAVPSLFQNPWVKSQPLLPDPPKSDRISDEASLAYQKGNKTQNINVWQQRLESRRPNIERAYIENLGSVPVDKHYDGNNRDGRDNRQRHDRERRGYTWGSEDQNERKNRRDNDPNERKERRDNDPKERRDNDPNERKERRDNDPKERRDNDPKERKERRDNDPKERRDNDPNERKERRDNDPKERRDNDPKERRDNDPKERRDNDPKERRDNDPNERIERRDNDPNERKERRDNDPNERKERRDNDQKERRDNDTNERKERRDNDPNERKERRDNDPNERKERRDNDPNERKERKDTDPNERKEKRDSDLNERKDRRDNDPHERKDRRDNDPNERKDRRENDPKERKERRENDLNERKDRRDNDPNEGKERRENDPNENKERREYNPNERKERRDNVPNERRDRRDNNPNEHRERREIDPNERKERRDKYRDRDRYRDRRGHYQQEQDHDEENGTSYPREQPRRGRGGSRSGRGNSRYSGAPSGYGGGAQGYGGWGANGDSNVSEHAGFPGDYLQNRDQGHDGRDGHVDGRNHRRDGRRQDDRNPPPPRFRRDEGMFDHRGPGSDRGRGRSSRGQGAGTQSNSISKRPVLTNQISNDGEEWETASESSEPKNGLRESRENMSESSTMKKGVSNQRPFSDRPSNHRLNYQDSRNSVERCNSRNRDDQQNQKNGVVPPTKSAANGATGTKAATVSIASHKENGIYKGDGGAASDISGGGSRKHADRKNDITDAHNKAVKAEQERKDALANIDINNIAGVVVVDDMQEVTLDDQDFLYEINDGFQEVTSKRTLKIKQKLIEAEHKKTEKEAQRKKEHHNKAAARSKCMSPKSGHMNVKGNKLPPRLAKQKEQREKEKLMTKDVMPKIELWDNELANNLPCLDGPDIVPTSSMTFTDNIGVNVPLYTMTVTNKTSMAPVMMSFSKTPAPAPPINAWMKPISFSPSPALGASQLQQVLPAPESHSPPQPVAPVSADVKMDKGDQHDSGIDVSDQPNSAASSSRSSPGTDNRLVVSATIPQSPGIDRSTAAVMKRSMPMDASQMITEMPKQQRLPKVSKSEKSYVKAEASATVMKKMDMPQGKELSDTKPEPIQMPPGYKDSIFGKAQGDHVNLELDFRYDESLSNSMAPVSERPPTPEKVEATFVHNDNIHLSAPVATPQTMMPPTSPATEVLSSKIASVKNFWDLDLPPYDHMVCMTSTPPIASDCPQSAIYVSNANTNNICSPSTANSAVFPDFGPEMGSDDGVGVSESQPALLEEDTSSVNVATSTVVPVAPVPRRSPVVQCMQSPHPAESVAMDVLDVTHSGMMIHDEKNMILEPSNVCKVRPQQLQMGLGLGNEAISMSMLSSGISGSMPTVASPPMMIGQHGFPAFQFGSQFVPQEARYTQPSFGYSLSQPQPSAGLGSQHQAPGPMGAQQTFNQPSLFISSTRTQAEYLSTSQLGFPQRGFGQPTAPAPPPAAQQSAILAPSATATLMSTNLKVPGSSLAMGPGPASAFGAEPLGKAMGPSQISFSNGLGSTSIPGATSQQLFFYDPNPTLGQLFQTHSQILTGGQASQNMASSQMMGSQLLQTRATVQPSSAFYQQPPAASYFPAQQSSTIQVGGPIQQPSSNQFSVQAFGSQHHGLGLALQPPVSSLLEMGNQNPSTLSLHGLPHQQSQALSMSANSKGSSFGSMVAGQQQTHQHFAATYNQQGAYSGHNHHQHHHLHSCGSQVNTFMGAGGPNTPQEHISIKQFESSHQKTNMTSGSNPNHFGDNMSMCPTSSAMMGGMLVGNMSYNASGNSKSSTSFSTGATAISPMDGSHIVKDRTPSMSISGPPSPQPPPPSQPPQKSLITRSLDTSTSHLNPNAPVFPATTKYSCSSAVGVPSTSISNITTVSAFVPSGTAQQQPQISVGKIRANASQGTHNIRPPFPNPIQRPDGPPVTSSQPQDMQQFGPNNNARLPLSQVGGGPTSRSNSSYGAPAPNPQYLNVMNLRNTALLSLISAAKNVLDQTLMSGGSHMAGDNPFAGRTPGAYMNPANMDGPPRPGPAGPTTAMKGPPQSAIHKGQIPASQHNPGLNLGQSQNPAKVPGTFPGPTGSIKAQQALQRQELLTHAANFLNASKGPTASKTPPANETSGVAGPTPVGHPRKPGDRKPALAMVSNPSLVGTSVKINFTASSNSRAPALPVTTSATVSATTSLANINIKNSTNSSCTQSVSAASASSSVYSAGHKEGKEN